VPDKDDNEEQETDKPVQRLCSEIQLFDLCDLEQCSHKQDRYCTNGELLTRFERISEKDDTRSYLYEKPEEGEEPDADAYGDVLDNRDDDGQGVWEDD
jgi:hypothetical protein